MKLVFLCHQAPKLNYAGIDKISENFLKKRLAHFFPDHEFLMTDSPLVENSGVVVEVSLYQPLLDETLVKELIQESTKHPAKSIISEGAIPGTSPIQCYSLSASQGRDTRIVYWNSQTEFSSQWGLQRLKRAKVFRSLVKNFPDSFKWTFSQLTSFFSSEEGKQLVLKYDEDIRLEKVSSCPLCNDTKLDPVFSTTGHPVVGFLTSKVCTYVRCRGCGLVNMDPQPAQEDLYKYYDVYETEACFRKVDEITEPSESNTSHFNNYLRAIEFLKTTQNNPSRCLDFGGGQGEFSLLLKKNFPNTNVTLMDFNADEAKNRLQTDKIQFVSADLAEVVLSPETYDVITMWEVIEHFRADKLTSLFKNLHQGLKKGGYFIFSTPDFNDPSCRALDFWSAFPGHHLTVLSRKPVERLALEHGFEIVSEKHEAVTLKLPGRWFHYQASNGRGPADKAESSLIEEFLKDDHLRDTYKNLLREKNIGSEIILFMQKK